MIEQVSSSEACRVCGAALDLTHASYDHLCETCRAQRAASWQPTDDAGTIAAPPYPQYAMGDPQPGPPDPDRPRWGVWTGIGVWLFSVAAIFVVPAVAMLGLVLLDKARGIELAPIMSQDEIPPRLLLVGIYATLVAHLITLAFCWAVVTNFRKQPFFSSLGWNWAGRSPLYWLLVSLGVFALIMVADQFFIRVLPQSETSFDKMLKSSQQVRIAVAVLATVSAPIIEEIIYRGIVFGGIRKHLAMVPAVITVTLLFAGVHVLQYLGAWASLAGLTLLSFILTVVRARTRSLLPSILIHFVNNAIVSVLIVFNKA